MPLFAQMSPAGSPPASEVEPEGSRGEVAPKQPLSSADRAHRTLLPGLDGIRALAACAVFLDHAEQDRQWLGLASFYGNDLMTLGRQGVEVFFVLSGFLITYLLLDERQRAQARAGAAGSISLLKFYARRTLRIWPVYYLVVLAVFVLIPYLFQFAPHLIASTAAPDLETITFPGDRRLPYYLFFLVNVSFWIHPHILFGAHLWSIGVEEQFYIVWPVIFRYLRWPIYVFVGLIALKMGFHYLLWAQSDWVVSRLSEETRDLLNQCATMFHYEAMATGAVAAYLAQRFGNRFRAWISRLTWGYEAVATALLVVGYRISCYNQNELGWWSLQEAPMFLYAISILILSQRETAESLFDLAPIRWFGQRSYGFYMYHTMSIGLAMALLEAAGVWREGLGYRVLFYVVAFGISLSFTSLSFRFLETPVLRLKDRYFSPNARGKQNSLEPNAASESNEREGYARGRSEPNVPA